jgi:hypothetical protein
VENVVVLLLAVIAGVGVYFASLRWGGEAPDLPGEGFLPEEERSQSEALQVAAQAHSRPLPPGEYGYVPMAPGRRSVQTRLLGVLGIVVLVPLAAVVFAFATYLVGRVLVETVSHLIENAIA